MAADEVSIQAGSPRPVAGADFGHGASPVVVRLWGEHDIASASIITAAFVRAVDESDADVVVDLTPIEFMDCSTVRALVSGRAMLEQRSRRLTVRVSPFAFAHRLLVLCGQEDMVGPTTVAGRGDRDVASALGSWVQVPRAAPDRAAGVDSQPDPPDDSEAEATRPTTAAPVPGSEVASERTSAGPHHGR